jgi:hypothetical protein
MATQTICDGCGKAGAPHRLGLVVQRDYCDGCATAAQAYSDSIDAHHTRLTAAFCSQVLSVRKTYLETLRALPDLDDDAAALIKGVRPDSIGQSGSAP